MVYQLWERYQIFPVIRRSFHQIVLGLIQRNFPQTIPGVIFPLTLLAKLLQYIPLQHGKLDLYQFGLLTYIKDREYVN